MSTWHLAKRKTAAIQGGGRRTRRGPAGGEQKRGTSMAAAELGSMAALARGRAEARRGAGEEAEARRPGRCGLARGSCWRQQGRRPWRSRGRKGLRAGSRAPAAEARPAGCESSPAADAAPGRRWTAETGEDGRGAAAWPLWWLDAVERGARHGAARARGGGREATRPPGDAGAEGLGLPGDRREEDRGELVALEAR